MKTHPKCNPKMEPKCIKNHSKNRCEKRYKKRERKTAQPLTGRVRTIAKPNHFKRHPSEWGAKKVHTLRKSNEGWVQSGVQKVKCKGKVQKGKCRVSAERQVQTGNPQRTQTRSVVTTTCGSMGNRLFRRSQVLFLCVVVFVCLGLCDCGFVGLWVRGCVD